MNDPKESLPMADIMAERRERFKDILRMATAEYNTLCQQFGNIRNWAADRLGREVRKAKQMSNHVELHLGDPVASDGSDN